MICRSIIPAKRNWDPLSAFGLRAGLCAVAWLLAGCRPGSGEQGGGGALDGAAHPWCQDGSQVRDGILLTADSLGPIHRTQTQAGLSEACPTLTDSTWYDVEGHSVQGAAVRFLGRTIGTLEWQEGGTPGLVIITDEVVRTPDNIGIGSRVSDLRGRIQSLSAGYDDSGVYVWNAQQPTISYLLRWDATSALAAPDAIADSVHLIPDTVLVRRLQLDFR